MIATSAQSTLQPAEHRKLERERLVEAIKLFHTTQVCRSGKLCFCDAKQIDVRYSASERAYVGVVHDISGQVLSAAIRIFDDKIVDVFCSCGAKSGCAHTVAVLCKYLHVELWTDMRFVWVALENKWTAKSKPHLLQELDEAARPTGVERGPIAVQTGIAPGVAGVTGISDFTGFTSFTSFTSSTSSTGVNGIAGMTGIAGSEASGAKDINRSPEEHTRGDATFKVVPIVVLKRFVPTLNGRALAPTFQLAISFKSDTGERLFGPFPKPRVITVSNRVVSQSFDAQTCQRMFEVFEDCGLERKLSNDVAAVNWQFVGASPVSWLKFQDAKDKLRRLGCVVVDDGVEITIEAATRQIIAVHNGLGDGPFGALDFEVEIGEKRFSVLKVLIDLFRGFPRDQWLTVFNAQCDQENFYFVLPSGQFGSIAKSLLRPMVRRLVATRFSNAADIKSGGEIAPIKMLQWAVDENLLQVDWTEVQGLRDFAAKLKVATTNEAILPAVTVPRGLSLRDYQETGVRWLQFLRENSIGGILADDMGLGKTVQSLAHICIERESGRMNAPFIVVCPKSVAPNWLAECKKFCPELRVVSLDTTSRHGLFKKFKNYDIVITTYSLVNIDIDSLRAFQWHGVILDEAQLVKNPDAKTYKAVCQLKSSHKIVLTGTPIENRLTELWSHLNFANPGVFGSFKQFKHDWMIPIETQKDLSCLEDLKRYVSPFILRRTKQAVEPELPAKTVIIKRVELEGNQRKLYDAVRSSLQTSLSTELEKHGVNQARIAALSGLMRLRQIACDSRLAPEMPGLEKLRGDSAKLDMLAEMLPEMVDSNRRILLFSSFTSMLDLVKPLLKQLNIPYVELTGDTKDRVTPVKRFQAGEVPVFLISLKAGGFGLNLTAADTVIHFDPWWNPAVENQATDRAHRIGQTKPVFVYKLIASDTVEDKVIQLQEAKAHLAGAVLDEYTNGLNLDFNEIQQLLAGV